MSIRPRGLMVACLAAGLGFFGVPAYIDKGISVPAGVSTVRRTVRRQRMQLTSGGGHPLPIRKKSSLSRPDKHTSRAKARKRARCKVKRRSHR